MNHYSNLPYNDYYPFNSSNACPRKNIIKHKKIKSLALLNDNFSISNVDNISFSNSNTNEITRSNLSISASNDNISKITKESFSISASNNNTQRNSFNNPIANHNYTTTSTNPNYSTQTYNPKNNTAKNGSSRILKKSNSSRNFLNDQNNGLPNIIKNTNSSRKKFNVRNGNHFNTINNSNSSRNIFNNQNSNSFNTINNKYSSNNPLKANIRKIPINPISNKKPKNFLNFFVKSKNPNLDFLVEGCKIPNSIFDEAGDCKGNWSLRNKTGPPGYLRDYIPPLNWIGIGLKVYGLYDYGDNTWLGNSNEYGEWYIGYHGTRTMDSIKGIACNGFRRGDAQQFKQYKNINPLTKNNYPKCGIGVYFTPDIEEAKLYAEIISYSGNKYRVVFMCRINPYKVRIASLGINKEYWIVNGDKIDEKYGSSRPDEVRPYRILIFKEN